MTARDGILAAIRKGLGTPPGPGAMRELADEILRGMYDGDVATALDRAAARHDDPVAAAADLYGWPVEAYRRLEVRR